MFVRGQIIGFLMVSFCFLAGTGFAAIGIFDQTADWGAPDFPPQRGLNKYPGSASFSQGVYHVEGQGDDIWDKNDEGFYLYTLSSGSQSIVGRVRWVDADNQEWSKIGLMMRENGADPYSRYYWCLLRGNLFGDMIASQWRDSTGEDAKNEVIHPAGKPTDMVPADSDAAIWFRITRVAEANLVMSEWSYDGETWNFGHSKVMLFPETIAWGIAITNHADNKNLAIAEVENLTIEKPQLAVGSRSLSGPTYLNSDSFFKPGDRFTVTIHLANTSDEVIKANILENIPEGWTVTAVSEGGVIDAGTVRWADYKIPAVGGVASYQVEVPAEPKSKAVFYGAVGALDIIGSNSLTVLGGAVGVFDGHVDIGAVEEPGDVIFNEASNLYEVFGGGNGVGGKSDEFHFLFKKINGPFSIQAEIEIDPFESSSESAKAGLMIRSDLAADSPYAAIVVAPDFRHESLWRYEKNNYSYDTGFSGDDTGVFELEKIGTTVNLYYVSAQAGKKTLSQSLTVSWPDPVYVGLVVTSDQDGALSYGTFKDLKLNEFEGFAERVLAAEIAPAGGGKVAGNRVCVHIAEGKSSSSSLTEDLPAGFSVENVQTTHGKATVAENHITWTLSNLSGAADLTYDLLIPAMPSGTLAAFNGSFAGLPIFGDNQMTPVFFQVPFIERKTVLDGILSEGEYAGAYSENFDHADRIPPGVHWSPNGGEQPHDLENATFYLYHDRDAIYAAIEVVDKLGLDFESGSQVWNNDSTELYFDGNLSRSAVKENNFLGFQATVLGNGLATTGNDAPEMVELETGGGASSNGLYWNAAARVKDTSDGYIVEYVVDKSKILDSPNRTIIGFDILMNGSDSEDEYRSKWGYWNTSLGSPQTDMEYWNNEQGWAIIELIGTPSTRIQDWTLY